MASSNLNQANLEVKLLVMILKLSIKDTAIVFNQDFSSTPSDVFFVVAAVAVGVTVLAVVGVAVLAVVGVAVLAAVVVVVVVSAFNRNNFGVEFF